MRTISVAAPFLTGLQFIISAVISDIFICNEQKNKNYYIVAGCIMSTTVLIFHYKNIGRRKISYFTKVTGNAEIPLEEMFF